MSVIQVSPIAFPGVPEAGSLNRRHRDADRHRGGHLGRDGGGPFIGPHLSIAMAILTGNGCPGRVVVSAGTWAAFTHLGLRRAPRRDRPRRATPGRTGSGYQNNHSVCDRRPFGVADRARISAALRAFFRAPLSLR